MYTPEKALDILEGGKREDIYELFSRYPASLMFLDEDFLLDFYSTIVQEDEELKQKMREAIFRSGRQDAPGLLSIIHIFDELQGEAPR